MKLYQLNLGTPLTKEQQRQITGGTPICDDGQMFDCICEDGTRYCTFGDGGSTTANICTRENACEYNGGYATGSACGYCEGI